MSRGGRPLIGLYRRHARARGRRRREFARPDLCNLRGIPALLRRGSENHAGSHVRRAPDRDRGEAEAVARKIAVRAPRLILGSYVNIATFSRTQRSNDLAARPVRSCTVLETSAMR